MAFVSQSFGQQQVSLSDQLARAAFRAVTFIENTYIDFAAARARRHTTEVLNSLSDTQLEDIGLSRQTIGQFVPRG